MVFPTESGSDPCTLFSAKLEPLSETYFVHLYGTKVSDDTTFTLTFRGRTTGRISWGAAGTANNVRDNNIVAALEDVAMELGGSTSTVVTCYGGFDPTPAAKGYSTAFGVNTAYCTIVLDKMYVV
jgi:hypothetical protein